MVAFTKDARGNCMESALVRTERGSYDRIRVTRTPESRNPAVFGTSIALALLPCVVADDETSIARGTVYHDLNDNRLRNKWEPGLAGVRVSNGRDIVLTDAEGRYEIPVDHDDIVFVIKPRGYRTPLSADQLPRFYYIHKPAGSPPSRFPGVAPTGSLPDSIDFPLFANEEPDQFRAILFGDPQPRNQKEVNYVAHDVVEELIGTDASFGVTLGDIAFDNLTTLEPQNRAIALIGIPWYNVIGNHDLNLEAREDHHSDETFERVYGPAYYSFDHGPVHFLVLDDVKWFVPEGAPRGKYVGGFGKEQMQFIRNDLALIPEDQLVVLMMHIPLTNVQDRQELYRLIEKRPFCMSISGHTHHHEHVFIKKKDGWLGAKPHHHVINVTVCGSWWSGAPDERGIPHTMMADGAPNGYSIIAFDGTDYRVDFKASGRPSNYQMNVYAPEQVAEDVLETTAIHANVFNGSERSKVEMRLDADAQWVPMKRALEIDPLFKQVTAFEEIVRKAAWLALPRPKASRHLWKATLPAGTSPGVYLLRVRETDRHGRVHMGYRVLRVTAAKA